MPIIRKEYYRDWEAIRHLYEQAFHQSTEADIVDALRAADKMTLSLVAESDRAVVGHILFSPATVDGRDTAIAALGPIAVIPRMQQHEIGTLLIRSGMNICRELGIKALVVLGPPDYYLRFGFQQASSVGLTSSWKNVPDQAFMAIELEPGALAGCTGTVRYAPEFNLAIPADQGL